jgi:tetratricopeptide (TPR) repeat protein
MAVAVLLGGCQKQRNSLPELPPAAKLYLERLQQALATQSYALVLALADSVAQYAPDWPDVHFARGLVYMQQRRHQEAEAAFRWVLKLKSDYPGVWYNLGQNAALARRYREALHHYRQELALARKVMLTPRAQAAIYVQMGQAFERLAQEDSAQSAYAKALDLDSTFAEAYNGMRQVLERQGRYEEALKYAQKAMTLHPEHVGYRYALGALLVQLGRFAEALPLLEEVARRWPGHDGTAYNLGRALIGIGRTTQGQSYLQRADSLQRATETLLLTQRRVELNPQDPEAWSHYAYQLMKIGYLDQAYSALQTALSLAPGNLALLSNLAQLYLAMGDTAAALEGMERIVRADSTFAEGWFNLGVLYAMIGHREAARRAWQRTLRLNPTHKPAQTYLRQLP